MMKIDRRTMLAAGAGLLATGAARAAARASRPDLTGAWTNGWYTQLERPKGFAGLVATPAEAEAYEAPRRRLSGMLPTDGGPGQAEAEFNEGGPGLARIRGEIRSSWITDPPDGKIPWSAEARERYGIGKRPIEKYDDVEDRPQEERCLTARGAFPPILNSPDTNYIQLIQTPGYLAIVSEKNHDARIAPILPAATPFPFAAEPLTWTGASAAHWEGATLAVETRRLLFIKARGMILTPTARVSERFTRSGPHELSYAFEVEDPAVFSRPWRGEMVFRAAEAPMYEYACHEGNYSLPSILAAARQGNQSQPAPPAAEPAKAGK